MQDMKAVRDIRDLPTDGTILIFGAGGAGRRIKAAYDRIGVAVRGFVDNQKTGTIDDVPVLDLPAFLELRSDDTRLVVASMYIAEIAQQLVRHGVTDYVNAYPLVESLIAAERSDATSPLEALSTKTEYLYWRMIRLEEIIQTSLRRLAGETYREQTLGSFDYQWKAVNKGRASHYNEDFRRQAPSIVCSLTGFDPSWFQGRRVLDAGCGDGRFSHALCALGASVLSVDMSEHGIAAARENCKAFPGHRAQRADLLALALDETFDLVFCFGVAHHTGDTAGAVARLADHVAPGGYLALMIYGQPRWHELGDFQHDLRKERLFQELRHLTPEEAHARLAEEVAAEDQQGWFDAATPSLEDHHTAGQLSGMLRNVGLQDIVNLMPWSRHLHFRARRP